MGIAYYPTQTVESFVIGSTNVQNPILLLRVGGVSYSNGFRTLYGSGYRIIFPGYSSTTNEIFLSCIALAYGSDLGTFDVSDMEVLIIG
jgi:hypothetical protein